MNRRLFPFLLFLALGLTAAAQSRGSYFFENSLLRSKLNPAFAPKNNYASFPGVGSFTLDMASNVGLKNFLYPDGEVNYLFLNDAVPADTFLGDLPRRDPYLQEKTETDLFGVGMKMGRYGYGTLSLSVVVDGNMTLSGDFLRYAKAGSAAAQGVFEGGTARLAGYAALAAGYSHDLSAYVEGLRLGMRLKLLVGLAAGHFTVDRIGMQFGTDQVTAQIHGTGALSKSSSLRSLGMAADFGLSYRFPVDGLWGINGWELSASVCDLGGLRYRQDVTSLLLDDRFEFSGIGDLKGDIQAEFEQAISDLVALTQIISSDGEPFYHGLPASVHVGATAHLQEDKAHVGLLYYHTVGHSNLMVAGGLSPTDWLNLGVNWTFLGPAGRLGFYAEYIPKKYLGLFLGMECASLRRNASFVPIRNFTQSIALGVNVLFGE